MASGLRKKIRIWGDKWLLNPCYSKVQSPNLTLDNETHAKELIMDDGSMWNVDLLAPCSRKRKLTLSNIFLWVKMKVLIDWFGESKKCTFSIRSAYHLDIQLKQAAKRETSSEKEEDDLWVKSWQLQILGKVKNFICHALKNILPTKFNLLSRKINCDGLFLIYKIEDELVIHVL